MEPEVTKNPLSETVPISTIPKANSVTEDRTNAAGQPMRVVTKEAAPAFQPVPLKPKSAPAIQPMPQSSMRPISTIVAPEKQASSQAGDILKPLRTYERDIAEMVRTHQTSAVSVNIARQKVEEKLPVAVREEKKIERQKAREQIVEKKPVTMIVDTTPNAPRAIGRNTLLAISSVVLIVLGVGLLSFFFFSDTQTNIPTPIQTTNKTLLSSDQSREINISGLNNTSITEQVSGLITSAYQNDTVTHINMVTQNGGASVSAENFFEAAAISIPPSLTRAFAPTMFAGIYTLNDKHPFYVVEIDSFDKAFEGMLAWEKNMYQDIGGLMRTDKATSDSISGVILDSFNDVIIANKDARALRNSNGEIVILYSFVDEKTLLIVDSEIAFKEILNRLASAKLVR